MRTALPKVNPVLFAVVTEEFHALCQEAVELMIDSNSHISTDFFEENTFLISTKGYNQEEAKLGDYIVREEYDYRKYKLSVYSSEEFNQKFQIQ